MSLACNKKNPSPSNEEMAQQKLYRDIGLSPVNNINATVTPCLESFTSPTYYMSGATNINTTGLDIYSHNVHNLSEENNFDLQFIFTGSTDYKDYDGLFCYSFNSRFPSNKIKDRCTNYRFIQDDDLIKNLTTEEVSIQDNEYYINSWDIFKSKCASNRLGVKNVNINTNPYIDVINSNYFVTVTNPDKPSLSSVDFDLFANIRFVNEVVGQDPAQESISNKFLLSEAPLGNVAVIMVNGVTMHTSDYQIDNNLLTITSGVTIESRDVVQAYYNKGVTSENVPSLSELIRLEVFVVTGITTGFQSSFSATTYENFVNYNQDNDRQEVFLKEKIDTSVQPVMTVNGINLSYQIDFFKSNEVENKLVMNVGKELNVGDVVSVFYYNSGVNNPGDLGVLYTDKPEIFWSTPTNLNKGAFSYSYMYVEVTDRDDVLFENLITSGETRYENNTGEYSQIIGPITTKSIDNYIYRVKFVKTFVDSYKNEYNTYNYSDVGSFKLKWDYINNTNF